MLTAIMLSVCVIYFVHQVFSVFMYTALNYSAVRNVNVHITIERADVHEEKVPEEEESRKGMSAPLGNTR